MLQYVRISNLALLDEVTLEFESGFTVFTGETGAGKSILIGALSLLAGARADKGVIRRGQDQLEVEAALYFADSLPVNRLLENVSLPVCEEGVLLLQRSIHSTKMPRIQINGSLATLAQLREVGVSWIDFHGPGEPQRLLNEECQLEMLDSYACHSENLFKYRAAFADWQNTLGEIQALNKAEHLDSDEIEFVKKQIHKIDAAEVSENSIAELERDYTRTSNAKELVGLAIECANGLTGEEGISDRLSLIVPSLKSLVELDTSSRNLIERVQSLQIELQDLGDELVNLSRDFEFDPETVEVIYERMNQWQELRRKYGGSVDAVLAKREELADKVALQGDLDALLSKKRKVASAMLQELKKTAAELTSTRQKAADTLAKKAASLLRALGFKKASLEIQIIPESKLSVHGDSRCLILFSANSGQALLPLNKIASSGEIARVMLALKTVLADADATPLLVFDEVDANVGGEVGRCVGVELSRLADKHQVFCVTHLPQVASLADSHFVVAKSQDEDTTTVNISALGKSRDARLDELARMLGDRKSYSARAHAMELLGEC